MAKTRTPALRLVTEREGGGKPITLGHQRWAIAVNVRVLYRIAKIMLGDKGTEGSSMASVGTAMMLAFIVLMEALAERFRIEGDFLAAYLAFHNAASAHGVLGDKNSQNAGNRVVLEYLYFFVEGRKLEKKRLTRAQKADVAFLMSKLFFGLLENDPSFAASVSLEGWRRRVAELEEYRYPDFPGRALRLAEKILEEDGCTDCLDEAVAWLGRGLAACQYGKRDQILDCARRIQALVSDGHDIAEPVVILASDILANP